MRAQVAAVRKYIQRQEEHHKRVSFKDELIYSCANIESNLTPQQSADEDDLLA